MTADNPDAHCYCGTQELDEFAMLQCQLCKRFFHSDCLKRGRPSHIEGDVLFDFTCSSCSEDGFERCVRLKLQWCHVVTIALYNLQLQGGGKCGYYRWREHICNFIDKNWTNFFGFSRKKTNTWHGTVAGILSSNSPKLFISSVGELKEPGWWSLTSGRPPTYKDYKETTSGSGNRKANRKAASSSSQSSTDSNLASIKEDRASTSQSDLTATPTLTILDSFSVDVKSKFGDFPNLSQDEKSVSQLLGTDDEDDDGMDINPGSISPAMPASPCIDTLLVDTFSKEVINGEEVKQESNDNIDESAGFLESDDDGDFGVASAKGVKRQRKHCVEEGDGVLEQDDPTKPVELVGIAVYEEKRLLRLIEKSQRGKPHDAEARRLRRKLIVRQQKRERNLPLFDLNSFIRGDPKQSRWTSQNPTVSEPNEFRILDRYRVGSKRSGLTSSNTTSFVTKLVGSHANEPDDIVSPYTTRILKPYIWRDFESQPAKWCILRDIAASRSKHDETWISPLMAPIDYRYVRPQYIPAINSLCREFFWPGIDLSDSLHYPDFSCVALYRKVVIGFAFMVPDVKYNEAYISFIFTHPEWRGAGIATFMLYHLIQTCMGKDVTLHVSATNPALLLYQKFGFKVEEFVVDFYDKYFPIESKECKHAMFLRLSR